MERRLVRANMLWKKEKGRVYLVGKGKVYVLNSKGAILWDIVHGKSRDVVYSDIDKKFSKSDAKKARELLDRLIKLGFVEEVPWMCF